MSRSLHERLRVLETEVRDLEVRPAAAVRARGRSRGRRQLAALTAAAAVMATTAGLAIGWRHPATTPPTGPGPGLHCVLALPASPAEVRVQVFDGGAPAGLPDATAAQLRARDYTVLPGTTDLASPGAADLRYGPAAIGAATLLRAALHDEVTMRFEPDRRDATVDLIVGPAFTRLATPIETNQKLVAGPPSAPPEC